MTDQASVVNRKNYSLGRECFPSISNGCGDVQLATQNFLFCCYLTNWFTPLKAICDIYEFIATNKHVYIKFF